MTYKKDPKMRYVDYAIFIDKNIHSEDADEEKLFQAMYHLFYILAVKGRLFQVASDYDSYALYGATQLFLRYKKEKNPHNKRALTPIKSSLNYIKRILYPLKVNYQKETFSQVFQEDGLKDGQLPTQILDDKVAEVRTLSKRLLNVEYTQYLSQIGTTIKHVLRLCPYHKDKAMLHNIELSCLLTLLRMMTMSNKNKKRLKNKEDRVLPVANLVDQIYAEEYQDDIVLYHLDKSMKNYIAVLVNQIKKEIAKDLRYIIGSFEPSDQVIKDVMLSPLGEYIDYE